MMQLDQSDAELRRLGEVVLEDVLIATAIAGKSGVTIGFSVEAADEPGQLRISVQRIGREPHVVEIRMRAPVSASTD